MSEDAEENEARKFDEEVLKHLRSKVPIKTAQIKGNKVEYFVGEYKLCILDTWLYFLMSSFCHLGAKAIDCLMESKWSQPLDDNASSNRPYFPTRAAAVLFCNR